MYGSLQERALDERILLNSNESDWLDSYSTPTLPPNSGMFRRNFQRLFTELIDGQTKVVQHFSTGMFCCF